MTSKPSSALGVRCACALAMLATLLSSGLASAQSAELSVTEIATSRGYEARAGATDPTSTFRRADGRIFVVIRLANTSGAEQDITVTFEPADSPATSGARGGVTLHVPASRRYRTVARTSTSRPAGRWRAVVRDSGGNILESVEFEVTE